MLAKGTFLDGNWICHNVQSMKHLFLRFIHQFSEFHLKNIYICPKSVCAWHLTSQHRGPKSRPAASLQLSLKDIGGQVAVQSFYVCDYCPKYGYKYWLLCLRNRTQNLFITFSVATRQSGNIHFIPDFHSKTYFGTTYSNRNGFRTNMRNQVVHWAFNHSGVYCTPAQLSANSLRCLLFPVI